MDEVPTPPVDVPADPPVACTLHPEDLPDRVREWRQVLEHVEARRELHDGVELTFVHDPDVLATLAAVATKEVACCAFFTFTLTIEATAARLTVVAPAEGVELVRELFGDDPSLTHLRPTPG